MKHVLRRTHGTIAVGAIDSFVAEDAPHEEETFVAAAFGPARQRTWLGGRAALRVALTAHGSDWTGPILATPRGGPSVSASVRASLSHKNSAVAALVSDPVDGDHLGIDLEETQPLRIDIARKVLTAEELECLPADHEARDVLVRAVFSIKEAIYKALDPFVGRYIGFHEVAILTTSHSMVGTLETRVSLRTGEGFIVESTWELLEEVPGYAMATARARRV